MRRVVLIGTVVARLETMTEALGHQGVERSVGGMVGRETRERRPVWWGRGV